jgi:hypothetical protein
MPDWDIGADDALSSDDYVDMNMGPLVDENGNPIPGTSAYPSGPDYGQQQQLPPGQQQPQGPVTQQWLDNVLGGTPNRRQPPPPAQPPGSRPAQPPQQQPQPTQPQRDPLAPQPQPPSPPPGGGSAAGGYPAQPRSGAPQ